MLPKLQAFYFKALLPELASPRDGKCPGIREPGLWVRFQIINPVFVANVKKTLTLVKVIVVWF
jgi:hypothetical protein